ncbi:MAG: NAD(P)H-dependent oxidoreductase subunit E [Caldilineaceae bacterium]|nr:NAD(P)H-dependent oxidoreductase subunit E [Caldilineaceae bacterium]
MTRQEQRSDGYTENIVVPETDRALIGRYRDEPAPLLPVLHAFHNRDGYIGAGAMEAIGKELRIPLADLYGTVTFYHHFSRAEGGLQRPRVCTGPVCCQRGALEIVESLDGAEEMPCSGRCDDPVPVLIGHETFVANAPFHTLQRRISSPVPVPNPGGREECVFAAIREPDRESLDGYRRSGGYEALTRAVLEESPTQVIDVLKESKLAGRGGAGFPTGMKWQFVREAPGEPKSIVCNADEGEPGCFKDRALMDHDPFAVIEGMTLAGYATGADRGFLYLRYEYPETNARLESAIEDAEEAGLLGEDILGSGFTFRLYLRRGAGAYICGEEGSLLNSLEGKHPFPRNRPPYPTTNGFDDLPTAVNNVETLCAVPQILRRGAEWYQGLGLGDHAGTKVISLSGDVQRPGNYEVPFGLPLRTLLYDWAGGPLPGRTFQAATMAGLSGGFLASAALERVTLDEPSIRAAGAMLGAAGVMVFDDSRDIVDTARQAMEFFAHESCGKCFPCRIGTQRLLERLSGGGPADLEDWQREISDIGEVLELSACGLGIAAGFVSDSLLRNFPEQVAEFRD